MEFGLGKNKQTQDLYPGNAIINLPAYDESNTISKVTLNEKAYEILGLKIGEENEIAFSTSKSELKRTYLINANAYDSKANIKVKKNGSYSNKNNFTVLKERFRTEIKKELLLEVVLSDKEFAGQKIFELIKFKPEITEEPIALADQKSEI